MSSKIPPKSEGSSDLIKLQHHTGYVVLPPQQIIAEPSAVTPRPLYGEHAPFTTKVSSEYHSRYPCALLGLQPYPFRSPQAFSLPTRRAFAQPAPLTSLSTQVAVPESDDDSMDVDDTDTYCISRSSTRPPTPSAPAFGFSPFVSAFPPPQQTHNFSSTSNYYPWAAALAVASQAAGTLRSDVEMADAEPLSSAPSAPVVELEPRRIAGLRRSLSSNKGATTSAPQPGFGCSNAMTSAPPFGASAINPFLPAPSGPFTAPQQTFAAPTHLLPPPPLPISALPTKQRKPRGKGQRVQAAFAAAGMCLGSARMEMEMMM